MGFSPAEVSFLQLLPHLGAFLTAAHPITYLPAWPPASSGSYEAPSCLLMEAGILLNVLQIVLLSLWTIQWLPLSLGPWPFRGLLFRQVIPKCSIRGFWMVFLSSWLFGKAGRDGPKSAQYMPSPITSVGCLKLHNLSPMRVSLGEKQGDLS